MATKWEIDHYISDDEENIHVGIWDNSIDPVRSVESGSIIRFECRDASNGYLDNNSTSQDVKDMPANGHPLTGPIYIDEAKPGDVLEVQLLDFQHKNFGVSYFYPGELDKGLLPEEFDEPGVQIWELDGNIGHFSNGIEIPLNPFSGVIGVAPGEFGRHSTISPRSVGGNLDIKHLTTGSTLFLPVEVDGAMFSIGDCHGSQGDGEVCVTGIEAPMFVTARLVLHSDKKVKQPQFKTIGPFTATGTDEPMYGTTGISDNLREAAKLAIRQMIQYLSNKHGLTKEEAHILCSVIVDLKINQLVNDPNWTVSAYLPESIFPEC